jgi:DNA/RNA-binding domain of Phe-tRNA-synthetase-like protein
MNYSVDSNIFESFPDYCRAVIVASNVNNSAVMDPHLEKLFRQAIREVHANAAISEDHPRINAWLDVYRTFPIADARKIRPSIASLVRRIKKGGKELPFISPLVCISNLVSLVHLTPSGLVDVSQVRGNLILGFALGTESFIPIGSDEVTSPEAGEIIYYDSPSRNVLCRAWNSRGGKSALTSPSTRSAVIDIDVLLSVIPEDELVRAANTAAHLITNHCEANASVFFLNKNRQSIEFPLYTSI